METLDLSGLWIIIILLITFLLLPFSTIRFSKTFYLYMFLFIPFYNVFLDIFVMLTGAQNIPDTFKAVKDLVWLYVLLCFILWVILSRAKIRFPHSMGIVLSVLLAYLVVQIIRSYPELGAHHSALAIRNTLGYVPAILLPTYLIRRTEDLKKIVRYFAYMMCGAAIYASAQMVGLLQNRYFIMTQTPELESAVTSFFSDYNIFAYFSGAVFVLILSGYKADSHRKFMLFALVLSAASVVVSQSRGGLIAFVFAFFLLAAFTRLKIQSISALVLVVSILLVFLAPQIITAHRLLGGPILEDIRFVSIWPVLWESFLERPLLGHGFGVFGFASLRIRGDANPVSEFIGVDNFYLTLALNTGIVGLALFFILMITIFVHSFNMIRTIKDSHIRNVVVGINIALCIFLISGVSNNLLESFPISVYFWFLIGTLCAIWR